MTKGPDQGAKSWVSKPASAATLLVHPIRRVFRPPEHIDAPRSPARRGGPKISSAAPRCASRTDSPEMPCQEWLAPRTKTPFPARFLLRIDATCVARRDGDLPDHRPCAIASAGKGDRDRRNVLATADHPHAALPDRLLPIAGPGRGTRGEGDPDDISGPPPRPCQSHPPQLIRAFKRASHHGTRGSLGNSGVGNTVRSRGSSSRRDPLPASLP